MPEIRILKINILFILTVIFFLKNNSSSQIIGTGISDPENYSVNTNVRWTMVQRFDTSTQSWGDTLYLFYLSREKDNKPEEYILKVAKKNDGLKLYNKFICSYQGDSIKSQICYRAISDTSFSTYPDQVLTYTLSDDRIVNTLSEIKSYYAIDSSSTFFYKTVTIQMKTSFLYNGSNIIRDSTLSRIANLTAEEYAMIKKQHESIQDTVWHCISRNDYYYNRNNVVIKKYSYDNNSNTMYISGIDSITYENNQIIRSVSYLKGLYGDFSRNTLTIYTYNNNRLVESVTKTFNDSVWVNNSRCVYYYTPYEEAGIKFNKQYKNLHPSQFSIVKSADTYVLKFELENPSTISISLFDAKGRNSGVILNQHYFFSGSHNIPLTNRISGYYICQVRTKSGSVIMPFTILK